MQKKCPHCASNLDKIVGFCTSCGHPVGRDVLLGGVVLEERYSIIKIVATSEYGNVYKAIDLRLGNALCCIKEMLTEYIDFGDRQKAINAFREEAYVLTGLKHQGLPAVRDYFDYSGKHYTIMEFIEGESLQSLLDQATKAQSTIAEDDVIKWGIEVCDILEYLHGQSPPVLFKEIRPSNLILRMPQKKLMLVDTEPDFRKYFSGKRHVSGIPGFTPREQYEGNAEPRSDLYALGKTLLYLLTGIKPSPFKKIQLSSYRQNAREGLQRVLEIATEENQIKRFSGAAQMKVALSRLILNDQIPQKAANHVDRALEYLKCHQIEEAILECNKALLINPQEMEAYLYLGHAYLKEGRAHLAIEKYRKAEKLDPRSSKVHCNKALALYQLGMLDEAIRENRIALELDPNNIYARNNLGSIYREMGKPEDAIDEYRKALEVDPRYMAAHYNLGLTYYEQGKFEESVKESELALESDPNNIHARINLSLAYFQLGKIDLFIECNKRVLDLDPNNARAFNNLGVASYAAGDYDEAVRAFRKALELDRNLESSQYNLKMIEDEFKTKEI